MPDFSQPVGQTSFGDLRHWLEQRGRLEGEDLNQLGFFCSAFVYKSEGSFTLLELKFVSKLYFYISFE